MRELRQADRNHKLADYVPFAERAYNTLLLANSAVTMPQFIGNLSSKDTPFARQVRPIEAMKGPPHFFFCFSGQKQRLAKRLTLI